MTADERLSVTPMSYNSVRDWHRGADVIVVGFGGAGSYAAVIVSLPVLSFDSSLEAVPLPLGETQLLEAEEDLISIKPMFSASYSFLHEMLSENQTLIGSEVLSWPISTNCGHSIFVRLRKGRRC